MVESQWMRYLKHIQSSMILCDIPQAANASVLLLLGRMFIFYGNKTSTQFLNFTPTVICSDDLQPNILKGWLPILQVLCFMLHGRVIKLLDQGFLSLNMKE